MDIVHFICGPIETNCYLIIDSEHKKALAIDSPPGFVEPALEILQDRGVQLEGILLTHTHWDHSADAAALKRETGAAVYVHKADEYRLKDPMGNALMILDFEIEPLSADLYVTDGSLVKCGDIEFEILHTPGHTEGGVCYVERSNRMIFTGDSLFNESIGRVDLPGGDGPQLLESIKTKILTLPDDYKALCGHGPHTNIGNERKRNPFLNGMIAL